MKTIFFISLLTALPLLSRAEVLPEKQLSFGFSLLNYSYEEFDDNNVFLDGEYGLIPGLVIGYKREKAQRFTELAFSYHSKEIDYDGHTQSGIPVKSRSDADIYDFQVKMGKHDETATSQPYELYGGLGYRFWQRDIHSTVFAQGIYEEYDWLYMILGSRFELVDRGRDKVSLDLQYTRMLNANIFVQLSDFGVDDVNLALGKENGFRISLPWVLRKPGNNTWTIEPYFEYWDISKSEVKAITSAGVPTGFVVWEPKSETRNYGINFKVHVPF